jgi:hypothetical protein
MSRDKYLQNHTIEVSGLSNDLNLSSENDINISATNSLDIQVSDSNFISSNDLDIDVVNSVTFTCDSFNVNASTVNINGSSLSSADPAIGVEYTSEIEIVVMNSAMEGGWTVSSGPGDTETVLPHYDSDGFCIRNKSGGNYDNFIAHRPLFINVGPNATYKLKGLETSIDGGFVPDTDLEMQVVECSINGASPVVILETTGATEYGTDTADHTMNFNNYAYFARIKYTGTVSNNSITPPVKKFKVTISKTHIE